MNINFNHWFPKQILYSIKLKKRSLVTISLPFIPQQINYKNIKTTYTQHGQKTKTSSTGFGQEILLKLTIN